jgi:hypothetical protein
MKLVYKETLILFLTALSASLVGFHIITMLYARPSLCVSVASELAFSTYSTNKRPGIVRLPLHFIRNPVCCGQ